MGVTLQIYNIPWASRAGLFSPGSRMRTFSSVRGHGRERKMVFTVPSTVLGALHTVSVLISQQTHNYVLLAPFTYEKTQTHR